MSNILIAKTWIEYRDEYSVEIVNSLKKNLKLDYKYVSKWDSTPSMLLFLLMIFNTQCQHIKVLYYTLWWWWWWQWWWWWWWCVHFSWIDHNQENTDNLQTRNKFHRDEYVTILLNIGQQIRGKAFIWKISSNLMQHGPTPASIFADPIIPESSVYTMTQKF